MTRGRTLSVAFVWALAACVLGPLLASLGMAVFDWVRMPGQPIGTVFEFDFAVFYFGTAASAVGLIPLTTVLFVYGRLAHRRPAVERDWAHVLPACLVLGVLCGVGVALTWAIWLVRDGQLSAWSEGLGLIATAATVAAFGLAAARFTLPSLRPGVFLESSPLGGRLRPMVWRFVIAAVWLVALTSATAVVETELHLPCPEAQSCTEPVMSRGLPDPFIQREFEPMAFLYDVLVIGVLHLPVIAVARRGRRSTHRVG